MTQGAVRAQTIRPRGRRAESGHAPDRRARWMSDRFLIAIVVAVAAVGGAMAAVAPLAALALVAAGGLVGGMLALGAKAGRVALALLVVSLVGYAFLGRAFSYLGIWPVFIGEALLVICIIALVMSLGRARFRLIHAVMLAFIVLGAVRTAPYLAPYGLDAARDGVTWIYCVFAIAVSILVRPGDFSRIVRWYGWFAVILLAWVPVSAVLARAGDLPMLPGTNVPIIGFKPGDAGVHLAGIAAFVLVGLYASTPAARRVPETVIWLAWLACAGIVAALNRGGMLAMTMAASVALIVRPSGRWARAGLIAAGVLLGLVLVNPTVDIGDHRTVSFSQLTDNVASVIGLSDATDLDGTRRWRLAWWSDIVDYTFDGPYFWGGKGFGVNLANADGYQVLTDELLRAPHNAHFEILAREGVPGFALWVVLQVSWLAMIVRAGWRARRQPGGAFLARVAAWVLAFWAAAMVNMSFDVYLQGPHGGIWYWAMFGLGIAVAAAVDAQARDSAATPGVGEPAVSEAAMPPGRAPAART